MRRKQYPIQVWFLDADLHKSAQLLSDKMLVKTMYGCMQALVASYFYFIGIRSNTFYKHYFDKSHKKETLEKFFPMWPLKKTPSFNQYSSKISKWCRKCKEHFDYLTQYLSILNEEYEYRMQKQHETYRFVEWLQVDALQLKIPYAHLSKIVIEWKSLNPRYRSKDIIAGYRKQYKSVLSNYDIKVDDFTRRDIPEWLLAKSSEWLK